MRSLVLELRALSLVDAIQPTVSQQAHRTTVTELAATEGMAADGLYSSIDRVGFGG